MRRGIRTGLALVVGCLALSGIVGTSAASAAAGAAFPPRAAANPRLALLAPAASRQLPAAASDQSFFTDTAERVSADGTSADLTVANPRVAKGDFDSVAYIEATSANEEQAVLVGWVVDPGFFKNSRTHLFTQVEINNRFLDFNADFKTARGSSCRPGSALRTGKQQAFALLQHAGDWQVKLGGRVCGVFTDTVWRGEFTKASLLFWVGEVFVATSRPCTQMGDGKPASSASAAVFSRIALFTTTNGKTASPRLFPLAQNPKLYSVRVTGTTSFRYGGSGVC
jgi:hypothetical protein